MKSGGKNNRRRQKSTRRGRISAGEKLAQATVHEDVTPEGFTFRECTLNCSRPVWRIIDGHAERAADHIDAGPDGRVPRIPGVPKRGEFGIEILTAVSFQHDVTGLSLDRVAAELEFFRELRLCRSQLDRTLTQWIRE